MFSWGEILVSSDKTKSYLRRCYEIAASLPVECDCPMASPLSRARWVGGQAYVGMVRETLPPQEQGDLKSSIDGTQVRHYWKGTGSISPRFLFAHPREHGTRLTLGPRELLQARLQNDESIRGNTW